MAACGDADHAASIDLRGTWDFTVGHVLVGTFQVSTETPEGFHGPLSLATTDGTIRAMHGIVIAYVTQATNGQVLAALRVLPGRIDESHTGEEFDIFGVTVSTDGRYMENGVAEGSGFAGASFHATHQQ